MSSRIYVPLDNSEHSNACIDVAVSLAEAFGAECTGSHVHAARMHDARFEQMDSLITTGLQLISGSYTDVASKVTLPELAREELEEHGIYGLDERGLPRIVERWETV